MNRLLSISLLLVAALATPCTFAQSNAPGAQEKIITPEKMEDPGSQKARQLLDQMIAALGGQAWLNYKTLSQEGRIYAFFHGTPTSSGILFWRFYEYPGKERREMTKQRDVVYIYSGDKGYEKTYKGTASEEDKNTREFARRQQHSLPVVIREWLRDPKTVLFYVGQSVADQQLVDVVSILNKDNDELSIGIDINSHLPINTRYSWRDPDKYKVEDETIYGNYRTIQGIATPFTVTTKRDGEITGQMFITHTQYNDTYQPGFFDATITYDPLHYRPKK